MFGKLSTLTKVLGSVAAIGTAASVAGLGTFGTFTSTTSASESVASGTVAIALGTAGSATNRLTVGASGLVPGDTLERAVKLSNTGTQALAGITLTSSATTSSLLDTDTTNGLQMVVQSCSVAWTEGGTAPAYTYTCSGTTTSVLTTRPVIQSNVTMPGLNSIASGGSDFLLFSLTFPTVAPNTLQSQSSVLQFSFNGTQRAATNQ